MQKRRVHPVVYLFQVRSMKDSDGRSPMASPHSLLEDQARVATRAERRCISLRTPTCISFSPRKRVGLPVLRLNFSFFSGILALCGTGCFTLMTQHGFNEFRCTILDLLVKYASKEMDLDIHGCMAKVGPTPKQRDIRVAEHT